MNREFIECILTFAIPIYIWILTDISHKILYFILFISIISSILFAFLSIKKININIQKLKKALFVFISNTISILIIILYSNFFQPPKQQLLRMGYSWNNETFISSIKQGNIDIVDLFVKGGMPFDAYFDMLYSNPWLTAIDERYKNNLTVLKIFVLNGFDLNKKYRIESFLYAYQQVSDIASKYGPTSIIYTVKDKDGEYKVDGMYLSGEYYPWEVAILFNKTNTLIYMIKLGANREEIIQYLAASIEDLKNDKFLDSCEKKNNGNVYTQLIKKGWRNERIDYLKKLLYTIQKKDI